MFRNQIVHIHGVGYRTAEASRVEVAKQLKTWDLRKLGNIREISKFYKIIA